MQEILAQQRNAAKPVTGKGFILGMTGVIIRLAAAQIAVNLLILLTGAGLLRIAFYLYAIWAIIAFMGKAVAGSLYTLKGDALHLKKMLGDSTVSSIKVPLSSIVGVRPVAVGERLHSSYRRVSVVDFACARSLRMRIAAGVSLVSATLARIIAGKKAYAHRGVIVAYMEAGKRCCCVFRPDEAFAAALESAVPDAFGVDERTADNTNVTMMAQALERAFPDLYAHVEPLVGSETLDAAKAEIARQKQEGRKKREKLLRLLNMKAPKTNEEAVKTDEVQDDTL